MTLLAVAFVALALFVYGPLVRTGVRRERA
jgi:hypothetical protein